MIISGNNIKLILVSFFITAVLGPVIIPMLKRMGIGQSIREEGPETHLSKAGTPTMGGLIILLGFLITVLAFGRTCINKETIVIMLTTLAFGLLGFIDDYIIVVRKDNQGLTARQKIIGQILIALTLSIFSAQNSELGTKIIIPFVKYKYLDLGILYIPFLTFVIVSTVNAVNLTDGLDGLASGVTAVVMLFLTIIANKWKLIEISSISAAFVGACIGFLIHNAYPAKVFMGDTGSLALGGAISAITILMNIPLIIPIAGGIYFIEALSVVIQVLSFKLTGKRVFLMSPLHHHFEEKGHKETSVVLGFWTAAIILCILAYFALN